MALPGGSGMERYLILGRVGEGAHGVVFKAKDRETGETVALKKVPLRRPEDGVPPQTLREIKALREIEDNPHVVRLRAAFAHGPAVVLAFEFVVGDLGGVLRAAPAPLPPARIRALLAMTLRGLGHCHRLRILHRDLKPANLLIDGAGRLKLADFGLARVLAAPRGRPYSHQVATRWYRAPELLYGARHYDEGVDLWSWRSSPITPRSRSGLGSRPPWRSWSPMPPPLLLTSWAASSSTPHVSASVPTRWGSLTSGGGYPQLLGGSLSSVEGWGQGIGGIGVGGCTHKTLRCMGGVLGWALGSLVCTGGGTGRYWGVLMVAGRYWEGLLRSTGFYWEVLGHIDGLWEVLEGTLGGTGGC
uniref:Cyclin-dependent kinase 20 n=1 Tax=Phasianus colchicus TaxID=9054 RepID=A0A669QGK4_PHACC